MVVLRAPRCVIASFDSCHRGNDRVRRPVQYYWYVRANVPANDRVGYRPLKPAEQEART